MTDEPGFGPETAETVEPDEVAPTAIAALFAQTAGGQAVADVTDHGVVVTITVPWGRVSDIRTPTEIPYAPATELPGDAKQDGQDQ